MKIVAWQDPREESCWTAQLGFALNVFSNRNQYFSIFMTKVRSLYSISPADPFAGYFLWRKHD
jgi:hypothetical protein